MLREATWASGSTTLTSWASTSPTSERESTAHAVPPVTERPSTRTPTTTAASRPCSEPNQRRTGEPARSVRRGGSSGLTRPSRLGGGAQHVADAPLGVDEGLWLVAVGPRRVDLATQIADVGLDDGRLPTPAVLPHVIEDLRLGQHATGIDHEVAQELELGGGQVDLPVGSSHLVGVLVELEVRVAQHTVVLAACRPPGAPQHGTDPRDELFEAEGLGDVVVPRSEERRVGKEWR